MRDAERRRRFVAWFNAAPMNGDRAKLMRSTGLTKGRVSQLFDEAQPFGERAATALARRIGRPDDFFEGGVATRLIAEEPRPPGPAFKDRHEVSDSDWATLQAVKTILSDAQLEEIRERFRVVEARAEQLLRERQAQAAKKTHT